MQKSKLPFKIQKYLIVIALLFVATPAFGAELLFGAKTTHVQTDEKFEVTLFVNTEQESINAFEGEITFPRDVVDLQEIRGGNTIVNFWIEKPHEEQGTRDKEHGAITFSGITPGGFNGERGLILSAIFKAKKEGTARFAVGTARVLRNDGTGSAASLTMAPFEVGIFSGTTAEIPTLPKTRDRERPESFAPEVAKDETLFDGKWFVVFAATDKGSDIDHYEVRETRNRRQGTWGWNICSLFPVSCSLFQGWMYAESPYVLNDQELRSSIWIKAVDKDGNERVAKVQPQRPPAWYQNYENWVIIILTIIALLIVKRTLWRKAHSKQNF